MCKWKYYNHALIPSGEPHKIPDLKELKEAYKCSSRKALFAMWSTEFDCGYETEWWYCIKDSFFDITELKAKRRYEINKGKKNFYVKEINPLEYAEQLFTIYIEASSTYGGSGNFSFKQFNKKVREYKEKLVYGAFDINDNCLCGYAILACYDEYMDFQTLKVMPKYENKGVNAAIVASICELLNKKLETSNYYISDGSRAIFHETNFQEYLEKYFGFRKAYCKLNIKYFGLMKYIVITLFPLRKIFSRINIRIFKQINGVLHIEEIRKTFL